MAHPTTEPNLSVGFEKSLKLLSWLKQHYLVYFASIFYTLSKGLGLTAFCPSAPRNVCRFCFLGCDTMTPLWEGILFFAQMWKAHLLPCGRSHCSHLLLGPDEAGTTEHHPPLALASPQHPRGNRLVGRWGHSSWTRIHSPAFPVCREAHKRPTMTIPLGFWAARGRNKFFAKWKT